MLQQRDKAVLQQRDKAVLQQRDKAVLQQRDKAVLQQRDKAVLQQRDKAVLQQRDKAVLQQRDKAVLQQRDKAVLQQRDKAVLLADLNGRPLNLSTWCRESQHHSHPLQVSLALTIQCLLAYILVHLPMHTCMIHTCILIISCPCQIRHVSITVE